jgi:excisionase family DNA binding protein
MSVTIGDPAALLPAVLAGFMSPDELAKQLGISVRTLARWHAQRVGPPRCQIGRLMLYQTETVRRWLAEQEQEPLKRPGRRR